MLCCRKIANKCSWTNFPAFLGGYSWPHKGQHRFQPNFKLSSLRACADHPRYHQGHQSQSGTSTIFINLSQEYPLTSWTPAMSPFFERVLDALKLNRFSPNFKHSFLRVYGDNPKLYQGNKPQSGISIIIIDSNNNFSNVINVWKGSWCLQTQKILTKS